MAILEKTDLRILRTRRLIVLAFTELIDEKGFDAITVQDIASKAMINRSTFYAHFTDKYDLFGFIIRESFLDYLHQHLPEEVTLSISDITLLTTAVFEYVGNLNNSCQKHQPSDRRPIVEAQAQSQLYEFLLDWLQKTSITNLSTKPESVASMMSWLIFGAGLQWNKDDALLEKNVVIQDVTQMITAYLLTSTAKQTPA